MPNQKKKKISRPRNKRRQPGRRQRSVVIQPIGSGQMTGGLSPCAKKYAYILANPFSGGTACIPRWPATPSLKTYTWIKATFTTGTVGGVGFVSLNPFWDFNNTSGTGGFAGTTFSSTSAYTGSVIDGTVGTTGVIARGTNSQFNSGDMGPTVANVQSRLVAAGLRIRYAGTELNRGGIVAGVQTPDHGTLVGASLASIESMDEHKTFRPTNSWISLTYQPSNASEVEFGVTASSASASTCFSFMGFIVQDPGISSTYEYEVGLVTEWTGGIARGKSSTHADDAGFSAVAQTYGDVAAKRPTDKPSEAKANFLVKYAESALKTASSVFGASKASGAAYSYVKPKALGWIQGGARKALTWGESIAPEAESVGMELVPWLEAGAALA